MVLCYLNDREHKIASWFYEKERFQNHIRELARLRDIGSVRVPVIRLRNMSDKKSTWVTNDNGKIVGKDTTGYRKDGSSTTTHQKARSNLIFPASVSKITGVTKNSSGGTSKHTKR